MTELLGRPMGLFIGLMIGLQVSEGQLREGPHNSEINLFSAMDDPVLNIYFLRTFLYFVLQFLVSWIFTGYQIRPSGVRLLEMFKEEKEKEE